MKHGRLTGTTVSAAAESGIASCALARLTTAPMPSSQTASARTNHQDRGTMIVTVAKKPLVHPLARCQGVADKKSTMPVLSNVLLTAEDGRLRVAATNLSLAVSGSVDAT